MKISRIDCSTIEDKYGADILEREEFDGPIKSLKKFVEHESWESIALDDGWNTKNTHQKMTKKTGLED